MFFQSNDIFSKEIIIVSKDYILLYKSILRCKVINKGTGVDWRAEDTLMCTCSNTTTDVHASSSLRACREMDERERAVSEGVERERERERERV